MTTMTVGLVHFIHGKESGPWGSKITALAGVARARGWDVASLDYSHTTDPAARLDLLLDACSSVRAPLVLVGSSMGGWVAAHAAESTGAHAVFLLAPALYVPGYPGAAPDVPADGTEIVHAWDDEVIPCEHAIRFARLRQCTLHLVQGDHRLNTRLPLLCELFDAFLHRHAEGRRRLSDHA
jgi:pimeloyl-ACP methyl ester carboxylesterase